MKTATLAKFDSPGLFDMHLDLGRKVVSGLLLLQIDRNILENNVKKVV
jgi:hypothetical protein